MRRTIAENKNSPVARVTHRQTMDMALLERSMLGENSGVCRSLAWVDQSRGEFDRSRPKFGRQRRAGVAGVRSDRRVPCEASTSCRWCRRPLCCSLGHGSAVAAGAWCQASLRMRLPCRTPRPDVEAVSSCTALPRALASLRWRTRSTSSSRARGTRMCWWRGWSGRRRTIVAPGC